MSTEELTAVISLITALAGLAGAVTAYLKAKTAHQRIDNMPTGTPPPDVPQKG